MWPLSEDRFRELLEALPAVFYADSNEPTPRTLYLSGNATTVLGADAEAHLDDPDLWYRSIHPDDLEDLMGAWSDARDSEHAYVTDYRYRRPDGVTVWLREHAAPVRDEQGVVIHWQGVLLDVTSEHETLAELRGSEERHRSLIEHVPAFVYAITDEIDFQFIYASPHGARHLGYRADEPAWLAASFEDVVHPDDRERVREAWRRSVTTGEPFDLTYRQVGAGERILWVQDRAVPIHDGDRRSHWQGVVIDITGRVEAEREAAAAVRRFETLEGQLPVVVYAISDEQKPDVLFISPNAESVLGYRAEDFVRGLIAFPDLVHPEDRAGAAAARDRARRETSAFDAEYRIDRPDGSTAWIRDTCEPIRDQAGVISFWQGVMLDVTSERLARLELQASEARRRALIENLPAIVYEMAHDDDRRTLYISSGVADLLGTTHREWLEQPDIWTELLHPDDREVELAAHDLHSQTGAPWSREYRLIAADGRVVWVRDVARLVDAPEGTVWQGVFVNITSQKEAEEALRRANDDLEMRVLARTIQLEDANELMGMEIAERRRAEDEMLLAEERFRHVIEHLPAVVYRWEVPEGVTTGTEYVSPWVEHMLGYAAEDWRATPIWRERLHPHDRDRVLAAVAHTERTGETLEIEYRYLARDGRVVWVFDRATLLRRNADGDPATFQGLMIDLTERKEAERRVTEAEERFRGILESGSVVSYAYHLDPVDPPTKVVEYLSPQMADILGFPLKDFTVHPERWFELMHPDDRDRMTAETLAIWDHGIPWKTRYRMITADGRVVWLHDRGRCTVRDRHGRPKAFQGSIIEVTAEVEAEMSAGARADLLEDVVSQVPAVLWREVIDRANDRYRYVYISPEAETVFGYTPEELTTEREHFPRLVHPQDRARVDAAWIAAETGDGRWEDEYRVVHRDGSVKWVHATGRRVTPPGTDPALWHGATLDVTHRHAREEPADTFAGDAEAPASG